MNSRWNENLIIFKMEFVSIHFDYRTKIRVLGAHQESTLGQTY